MKLSSEDVRLFYKLYPALLVFVNERNQIEKVNTPDQLMSLTPEKRLPIRASLYENDKLIDEFVKLNPRKFSKQEHADQLGPQNRCALLRSVIGNVGLRITMRRCQR